MHLVSLDSSLVLSSLNIDNVAPMNFANPINTLVTGEVIVERNEHASGKSLLHARIKHTCSFLFSSRSIETDKYSDERFHESLRWPRNTSARISRRESL